MYILENSAEISPGVAPEKSGGDREDAGGLADLQIDFIFTVRAI